jgi:hypothetical protein
LFEGQLARLVGLRSRTVRQHEAEETKGGSQDSHRARRLLDRFHFVKTTVFLSSLKEPHSHHLYSE